MRRRYAILFALFFAGVPTGCFTRSRPLPLSEVVLRADTMTKAALLEKLRANSLAIKTLVVSKSTLKASRLTSSETIKDYADVSGRIAVERPGHLRLEIEKVITLAQMVSDEKQYRVSIPPKAKFGVGDITAPVQGADFPYNLRPTHLLDALFVDGEQFMGKPDIDPILFEDTASHPDGLHSYYKVLFVRTGGVPLEELWFDRTVGVMAVVRKRSYLPDGKIEADIEYSDYITVNSIPFPKKIVIQRPIENYTLEMDIEKMELNTPVNPTTFVLNRPAGVVDVDLNTGKDITSK